MENLDVKDRSDQSAVSKIKTKNNIRLIARLDIKGDKLIKSVQLEGVRVVGEPREQAQLYYQQGADELFLMDAVASLYGRNHLAEVVSYIARNVFIPMTVGGGLRQIQDVDMVLRAGADKVAINTAVVKNPKLITDISLRFGSQCMVLQVDAKYKRPGYWEAYIDGGREPTGLNAIEWVQRASRLGAGEILVTSVDREGTRRGFDIELCKAVSQVVSVPVIASGGMGNLGHLVAVVNEAAVNAVAMADILHVQKMDMKKIKTEAAAAGLHLRPA